MPVTPLEEELLSLERSWMDFCDQRALDQAIPGPLRDDACAARLKPPTLETLRKLALLSAVSHTCRALIEPHQSLLFQIVRQRMEISEYTQYSLQILSNLTASSPNLMNQSTIDQHLDIVNIILEQVFHSEYEIARASALHLALLSHISSVRDAVHSKDGALMALHKKAAGHGDVANFVRWALRSGSGNFDEKFDIQLVLAQNNAATKMQASARGMGTRREYVKNCEERRRAALTTQRCYRGHAGRSIARATAKKNCIVATKVQAFARRLLARRVFMRERIDRERMDLIKALTKGNLTEVM